MKDHPHFTAIQHLADLDKYLGHELGISGWQTITQADITTFAKLTGDEQWIHVDTARAAAESPYGMTVAHGFMVLAYASKFAFECLRIKDVSMGLNYGLDKVRFVSPTPVNSEIRARIKLVEVVAQPPGVKYKLDITFERKGQEKPVCVAEWLCWAV